MVKNRCDQSGLWLNFNVSLDWTDGTDFLLLIQIKQIKGDWKILEYTYKNKCDQSGDKTLKLPVFEKWADGINWFYACWCRFTKIRSSLKLFWVGMVKSGCSQSGHKNLKLTVTQKWTDGKKTHFFHAGRNSRKV